MRNQTCGIGGAGECYALHALVCHQRGADDFARTRQQLQRCPRHAGPVQQTYGIRGHQRRLLRRLGQHRIAGGQRGGQLAGEDRQREVPRADAGERATAVQ